MPSRITKYPILDLILNRWSARAMSGRDLPLHDLMTILEAGRWAPSSYNNQPWHFIYGLKGTTAWDNLFNLLAPFNQSWIKNGSALVCLVAAKNFVVTHKPSRTHLFDAGAAWENCALQAYSMGLVVHGLEGFDYTRANVQLEIPDSYEVAMMFVIGYSAEKSTLTPELQQRENPSDRIPLEQIVSEGIFKNIRILKQ